MKNDNKNKISNIGLIILSIIMIIVGIYKFIELVIINKDYSIINILTPLLLIIGFSFLLYECFPHKRTLHNPSLIDNHKKENYKINLFKKKKNDKLIVNIYDEETKYTGATMVFYKDGNNIIVQLEEGIKALDFLKEEELHQKIYNDFINLKEEYYDKCRNTIIEKDYKLIYDWIKDMPWNMDYSPFYIGNKNEEEYKQVLYDNLKFNSYYISLDKDYKIISLGFSTFIQELSLKAFFDLVDGQVDFDSMSNNFER